MEKGDTRLLLMLLIIGSIALPVLCTGIESEGLASGLWDQDRVKSDDTEGTEDLPGISDTAKKRDTARTKIEFGGRFRTRLAADTDSENQFEDEGYGHAELILETKWKTGNRFQIVATVDADYLAYRKSDETDSEFTIKLHDTFLNYSGDRFNLKLGNQTVRWGKTDGFSPLDNLNPEDYRDGIAGRRENRKIPIPMANCEIYSGNMTFQGVFVPYFVKPELDYTGRDWAVFQHAGTIFPAFHTVERKMPRTLENSEFGLRVSGIIHRFDFAASWFQAFEDIPVPDTLWKSPDLVLPAEALSPIDLAEYAALTGQTVELARDRQNIFGLELETTLGALGVRADTVYFDSSSFQTEDLIRIPKASLQYMIGVDYNSPDALYANLQFLQIFIEDYEERILWSEEVTSALIGTFQKTLDNGNWEIECRGYYDLSGDATMINPKLVISYWQPLRLEICGEFFDGSVETPVGFYSGNDQIYAIMEINF